jgi:hypothetical protein
MQHCGQLGRNPLTLHPSPLTPHHSRFDPLTLHPSPFTPNTAQCISHLAAPSPDSAVLPRWHALPPVLPIGDDGFPGHGAQSPLDRLTAGLRRPLQFAHPRNLIRKVVICSCP